MQIINLAVAFITGSDLLILDEPTTFLDLKYRKLFLDYIRGINDSGRTIIHVTQYTDEALHSRNACVMDSGSIAARGEPYRVLSDDFLLKRSRLSVPVGIEFKIRFGFDFDDSEKSNGFISGLNGIKTETDIDSAEDKTVISVENLSFSYPETGFSLSVDSLNLYENQIAGLVGPSGSGKSTLALLLAGILNPLMGAIEYIDKEKYRTGSKKFVALSWQMPDPVLIGPTVREDLQLAFANPGQGDRILESLLEKTGLAGFDDRIVDTLSGGEKRKLSLASVLAAGPGYLILDEPAAFLDPVSQKELRELIREISRSVKGALIIGHDLIFLSELVDRVIGIKEGAVAFDLPAGEFFSNPRYSREIGLEVDPMISFRGRLAESGIELPFSSLKPARIMSFLKKSSFLPDDFS
jgi:energy-coupling factor transporter ATP-binding protein EcfA2